MIRPMSLPSVSRPRQMFAGAAALLILAGCSTAEPPAAPPAAETTAAVTLEGSTGTLELTGDPEADIAAMAGEDFPREYVREIACEPPADDDEYIFWSTWSGEMRYVVQQEGDWDARKDAVRITAHYACPEHYDVVDEALE